MRTPQSQGTKGSSKWIQILINSHPEVINRQLRANSIDWLSPLEDDQYAEYRDAAFVKLLGLEHLQPKLKDFWPKNGPQWDALGKAGDKKAGDKYLCHKVESGEKKLLVHSIVSDLVAAIDVISPRDKEAIAFHPTTH